jgi:hypothetical protein
LSLVRPLIDSGDKGRLFDMIFYLKCFVLFFLFKFYFDEVRIFLFAKKK